MVMIRGVSWGGLAAGLIPDSCAMEKMHHKCTGRVIELVAPTSKIDKVSSGKKSKPFAVWMSKLQQNPKVGMAAQCAGLYYQTTHEHPVYVLQRPSAMCLQFVLALNMVSISIKSGKVKGQAESWWTNSKIDEAAKAPVTPTPLFLYPVTAARVDYDDDEDRDATAPKLFRWR
jgi:hypothetical protein